MTHAQGKSQCEEEAKETGRLEDRQTSSRAKDFHQDKKINEGKGRFILGSLEGSQVLWFCPNDF